MKLKNELIYIFKKSFDLVSGIPILWLFFYSFTLVGLFISTSFSFALSKILTIVFGALTMGLPALKVKFLANTQSRKKIEYKKTPKLLAKYFVKLLLVTITLLVLGIIFTFTSNLIITLVSSLISGGLSLSTVNYMRMISFLPLSIIYFALFHLFIVVLVKTDKKVWDSLKLSINFIKKNLVIVSWIIVLSLIIHYPVSDALMRIITELLSSVSSIWIKAVLGFFNTIIELFFFAVWMSLYNKKS